MTAVWQSVPITRAGTALSGSPFLVKVRYRRLHIDPQIAPISARRPIQEFLIFSDIGAPVDVGDSVTLPEGTLTKIIDVRSYPSSLQCMLQRLPYVGTQLWLPATPSSALHSDKSLPDVLYSTGTAVLAAFEPHGVDQSGPLPIGHVDRRSCWIFSVVPLAALSVLYSAPDYWLVTASSSVWPVSSDYRAPGRRLAQPPLGVT
jgi:hypothetical protein